MIDDQTKQAIYEALRQLDDGDSSVRAEAARRLGAIGNTHPQIIGRLQAVASNDASPDVVHAAKQSLELLQPPQMSSSPQTKLAGSQSGELSLANERTIIELLERQNDILEHLRDLVYHSTEARAEKKYRLLTRVVDFDMSISSMANLMLKWFLASIPAGIVIGCVVALVVFTLGSCASLLE